MMGVIQTDAYTRTGRRVVDMRQPRRAVAAEGDAFSHPFQAQATQVDGFTEFRLRGGKVQIIDGDRTHYEIAIGTVGVYGAWIGAWYDEPYYIAVELTCSDADPAEWTATIIDIPKSGWPLDETGKKHFLIAQDDASGGYEGPPEITQLWTGGDLILDYGIFGAAPLDPVKVEAQAGTSKQYARDDHQHRGPTWDIIRAAEENTDIIPDEDADSESGHALTAGTTSAKWESIKAVAYGEISLTHTTGTQTSKVIMEASGSVYVEAAVSQNLNIEGASVIATSSAANGAVLTVGLNITLGTASGKHVIITNIPTSNPAVAGALWSDGGTLKISSG